MLDISKTFDRVWYAGLLHKLNSYGISSRIFGLISVISNRRYWVVLDGEPLQEYAAGVGAPQWFIFCSSFFLFHINDLTDDVICNTPIYAVDTILYSKCDQASDLWQKLRLVSELESDIRDTLDWGRKWLAIFNPGKTQLVLFDQSNNSGAMM